jgi:hypothetical protein
MNCCDYNCTQGRDCPARKTPTCPHCRSLGYDASGYACTCTCEPAKVAKARPVMLDREILPPTRWRIQVRELAKWMLGVLALLLYAVLASAILS